MARPSNHPYGERILRLQTSLLNGRDVWELQIKLIGWGSGSANDGIGNVMDPVRVTGNFDTTTRDAVMRFQKAHKLPITGVVDSVVFLAIDKEAALHPLPIHDLKCPCARGDNDGEIPCRCNKHPVDGKIGKCDGFGKERFSAKFLLDGKKLADESTDISGETLDLYDMKEYKGMDKALLWAVRALLCRAGVQKENAFKPIKVIAGYRCWLDNYHHTDVTRWHHRRSTFNFGKAIEFFIAGYKKEDPSDYHCTVTQWKDDKVSCPQCDAIRKVALEKCGFQLRWQEPNRVSVAEGKKDARPPATPFSVHIDTVRRLERQADDFVETDFDAVQPLYEGKISSVSFPLDLGAGINPQYAPSQDFFTKVETGQGGWFPMGASRTWHSGIHIHVNAGNKVYVVADGEIIGCRVGEDEDKHAHGSRNFVLVKHSLKGAGGWKDKVFYSFYMGLDGEKPTEDAKTPWRQQLFLKSKPHVEAIVPSPLFKLIKEKVGAKGKFIPCNGGLAPNERIEVTGSEVDAKTLVNQPLDKNKDSNVVKVAGLDDTYIFTKLEGKDVAKLSKEDASLAGKFDSGAVIALKDPIKIFRGNELGKVASAPTHDSLKGHGSFLHFETFAEKALPVDSGFEVIDVADKKTLADRKEVISTLVKAKLLPQPTDGVLLHDELKVIVSKEPYNIRLRSAVLKCRSPWATDWKQALKDAKCYGFLKDSDRDALGDVYNKYSWWEEIKKIDGLLPASDVVYHYHPIALLLQIDLAD